ncbi:MAG: hypothetical protein H6644_21905 [Caldilineaceae bacterium]|nr:hypothetical protein [Caldilineaceae bacterium]
MMQTTARNHNEPRTERTPAPAAGLPVRTDLRAGLAWDDLDDQAKNLWNQISTAVSNAVSGGTDSTSA